MYRTRSLYTTAGFQVNQHLVWQRLSDDQSEAIVGRTFELLERTGVDVLSADALKVYAEAGCHVDGNRVRIPTAKSEWALRCAPSRVTLCDRNGNRAMLLENNEAHWGPGYTAKEFIEQEQNMDTNNSKIRPFTIADVEMYGKLCDALPNISFAMPGGFPTDVDEATAEVQVFKTLAKATKKPIVQNVKNADQATKIFEMAAAIAGSAEKLAIDPFVALHVVVNEPLQISAEAADVVAFAAGHGLPIIVSNELVSGFTAPADSAGVLMVALANSIAALVLAQLTAEGASFITGGFFTNNDTVNELHPYGSPEISLLGGGFANVLRSLRIPSFGFAGGTDAKCSDAQLGREVA
ncbi:MAG: trimethylamine methyltransferase family protein, partial [Eggerthellaceae bacterium]|nr:trimethylamine methyltransferase family protein [Eggerthellaceae bacterium]